MDKEDRGSAGPLYMGGPGKKKKKKISSSKVRNPESVNGFGQDSSAVKKKVRRRLHTNRPYQERLVNMAEARREIVTALKFHRASMQQRQQHEQEQSPQLLLQHGSANIGVINSATPYPSNYGGQLVFSDDKSPSFTCQNYNCLLPSQTLGLNLNFQDFSTTSSFKVNTSPSSSSSSTALSSASTEEILLPRNEAFLESQPLDNMGPYPEMNMKEMKSMADCHDMVWNDTMNMVTYTWWFNFSKATETRHHQGEDDHLFSELPVQLPSWLNPTDFYSHQHLNIASLEDFIPDPALPSLDIEEIEGMDGDWLA